MTDTLDPTSRTLPGTNQNHWHTGHHTDDLALTLYSEHHWDDLARHHWDDLALTLSSDLEN